MAKFVFLSLLVAVACVVLIQESNSQQDYRQVALDIQNGYRAKHGAPPLVLDDNLNNLALRCAQYYANKRSNDHSCPYKDRNKIGENIAGAGISISPEQMSTMGPKMWYEDEVGKYNYNNPVYSDSTGHFTQVVWKSSQKFGFASVTANGFTSAVGLYEPTGNFPGRFKENVLPPGSAATASPIGDVGQVAPAPRPLGPAPVPRPPAPRPAPIPIPIDDFGFNGDEFQTFGLDDFKGLSGDDMAQIQNALGPGINLNNILRGRF